jgi:hypothetical protein
MKQEVLDNFVAEWNNILVEAIAKTEDPEMRIFYVRMIF